MIAKRSDSFGAYCQRAIFLGYFGHTPISISCLKQPSTSPGAASTSLVVPTSKLGQPHSPLDCLNDFIASSNTLTIAGGRPDGPDSDLRLSTSICLMSKREGLQAFVFSTAAKMEPSV